MAYRRSSRSSRGRRSSSYSRSGYRGRATSRRSYSGRSSRSRSYSRGRSGGVQTLRLVVQQQPAGPDLTSFAPGVPGTVGLANVPKVKKAVF